jgi:hypothetical protein
VTILRDHLVVQRDWLDEEQFCHWAGTYTIVWVTYVAEKQSLEE